MNRLLLVEDDRELNLTVSAFLRSKGFRVASAYDVNEAWDAMYDNTIDLIISDIMMPNIDGFEFVRMIREEDRRMPIIFISAREDFDAKSKGFREGIDDYLVKPFEFEELYLRIVALLHRAAINQVRQITIGDFVMDEEERTAYNKGEEIRLTQREFDVLYLLLSYPKKPFTRDRLMEKFWPSDSTATPRTVDVFITRIREKTANCNGFEIVTVHGLGYKAVIKK